MLGYAEIDAARSKRLLLSRMKMLLAAGSRTREEDQELRALDAALRGIQAALRDRAGGQARA